MKIRRRTYASGRQSWQLDLGVLHGRRVQVACGTREEAEAEMVKRKALLRSYGHAGFALSESDRLLFVEAREKLAAVGATITQAVEHFLKTARPPSEPVTWAELVRRCLEAKEDEGCDARYVAQMRSVARSFGNAGHAERLSHEITAEHVHHWLRANQWAAKTWNNYLTDLRTIFEWARRAGHVPQNPCMDIPRKKSAAHEEVAFLTVRQCQVLLDRAAKMTAGAVKRDALGQWIPYSLEEECFRDCVPMVVIGLFCGLRPEKELGGMTWRDVKLESKVVIVTAGRAKSRKRRPVELSANALAWLRWWISVEKSEKGKVKSEEEKICPKNLKRRWKRLRQACGIFDGWPHDGLRHTYATYHYAQHQNEAKLQVLMGHRSAQMLHAHYRGLATPKEAAEFWALRPPVNGKA